MTAIFNYSESFTSEKLGVATAQCLVFKDSDSGIQSALAAGCKVISVNNQTSFVHSNFVGGVTDFTELEINVSEKGMIMGIV
ncbi:hypothetical protein CWB96_16215 [Pseudoalteromonas citrea]|uniref:Uncharacterized protein n=1 Tax=Pseudoalteromonas citrea TaxID=43655 RepID=A0A5S3XN19_9GAMM|nr:hypothetical protein [Pseudoalteromonas citrea]TMP44658.1 hypothetical protein CWB97_06350 [Pseudoalteromonas citrea]TMP55811.1 hypothetical protein CWB96_16215 [Pseudoalteromonas citrea]